MDSMKINQLLTLNQVEQKAPVQESDGSFKFTLVSRLEDAGLQERLTVMMQEIEAQGKKLGKHMDIRDMRRYRQLVHDFMNEVVSRSHQFSRENFLDKRGRHRIYGMVRLIDQKLDELAAELIKEEQDNLLVLDKIDEIRGLLLDVFS